ncbi:MAG: class I SAM-dependent methyltransferase, partial [candidate division NC10 bacterium]|nr:class I SAM-dependent methyltransferase [candidate division NC10 bacterium]
MDEIKNLVDEVHGWLTHSEGQLLFRLAKACTGRGVIVEIGSWKGKSTIWLAKGSRSGNKVKIHAIDPHTGSPEEAKSYGKVLTFEEFTANVKNAGVDDTVIPIIKTSSEAAQEFREPIELIFIDGDHQYDMVKLDFELWFPKVIDGGIMAFHD